MEIYIIKVDGGGQKGGQVAELDSLMTTLLLSMNRILVPINMFVVMASIKTV